MKMRDDMRAAMQMPNVVVPNDFTICGIEEWHSIATKVDWVAGRSFRIPLGLCENVLRPQSQLFCLDHAKNLFVKTEGVVGGAIIGRILLNRTSVIRTEGLS